MTQPEEPAREIVVVGYAKMPEGTAGRRVYETLIIGVSVDAATHTVIGATTTMVTDGGKSWVARHLEGQNLLEEPAQFVQLVQRDYWGQAQGPIIHCYRDIVRRYRTGLAAEGHPVDARLS